MKYKKLLIQQQKFDGSVYINVGSVIDTQAAFHVACQEFPFKMMPETKELPKREWYDEHGDDVYVPTDGLKMKAYDLEVTFLYVGNRANMGSDLKGFIKFIYGRNNGGAPMLAIYDEFTGIGKRGCYVTGVNNDLYVYDDANEHVVSKFKVKFRVTDPVTDITLS
jgi:hypothetical protein